jgi:arsenate reductase
MLKIYGIKSCNTMKKARAWLEDRGVEHVFHDYKSAGVPEERLRGWVEELGWEALVNTRGTTWRRLPEEDKADLDAEKAVRLMLANPSLIKRPVLDLGDRRVVGFSEDQYADLFPGP